MDSEGLDRFKEPNIVNTTPLLRDLCQYVTPQYATDWEVIGILLGLPVGELKIIEAGYPTDLKGCCNEMWIQWLQVDSTASWRKLFAVIESPVVSCSTPDIASVLTGISDQKRAEAIVALSKIASQFYIQSRFMVYDNTWPPEQPMDFIPLLLMHYQGHHTPEKVAAMAELMYYGDIDKVALRTGAVKRSRDNLQQVLNAARLTKELKETLAPLEKSQEPSFVLIEGATGTGKSVLLKEIAYRWGQKQLLQNYELVLLVDLCRPYLSNCRTVDDLFQILFNSYEGSSACAQYFVANGGKALALLFDGYDMCSRALQNNSLIADILKRHTIPLCGLVVASRPHMSAHFRAQATVNVEILGFTETERELYVKQALYSHPHKIKEVQQFLDINPSVDSICSIPFYMVTLLYLYKQGITFLKSCTEIYHHFIRDTIMRYLSRYGKEIPPNFDLNHLPEPCNRVIKQLSKLSLEALNSNKLIFSLNEIIAACPDITTIPGAINGFGLLQAVEHLNMYGKQITFNFVHYTVQDFLAAHYLYHLPPDAQLSVIKANIWSSNHFNMFYIYTSLTKGQQSPLRAFLSNENEAIAISYEYLEDPIKNLFLYYCFYGAGDHTMCNVIEQAKIFQSKEIKLSSVTLMASNIKHLARFLTSSVTKEWEIVYLSHCSIQDSGLNILHHELHHCTNKSINQLWLSNNALTVQSSSLISELSMKYKVKMLVINDNSTIGEDQQFFSMLSNPSTSLECLQISNVKLSSAAAADLFNALRNNSKLKDLNIENNSITDDACDMIISGLQNSCLVTLGMYNNPLSSKAIVNIVESLKVDNSLNRLGLPDCPLDIKENIISLQEAINKERKSQGYQIRLKIFYAILLWETPDGTGLRFDEYSVLSGFNILSSSVFESDVIAESYDIVEGLCKQYVTEHWVDESLDWNVSSMNELFNMLKESSYYNPFNPGLLKFLANEFRDVFLINSVKNYEETFSYKIIQDLDFIREVTIVGDMVREESTLIVATLKERMTIGEVMKFCTPRVTKHKTNISGNLINGDTLILDSSESLLNFYYSIKDNEIFLSKAKQENQVIDFQHIKILLIGSAAVGKTSFRRLLFQSKHSSVYNSTEVMETQQASSVVNFSVVKQATNEKEVKWLKLDPENQIAHFKTLLQSQAFHQANVSNDLEIVPDVASTSDITDKQTIYASESADDPKSFHVSDGENDKNDKNSVSISNRNNYDNDINDDYDNSYYDDDDKIVNSSSGGGVAYTDAEKQILSSKSLPQNIEIDKNEAVKLITVIDSGGQPEYINMLPVINNRPTISLIILDMTKGLDDPVMVQYKSKHSKNFRDYALHYSNLDLIKLLVSLTSDSLQQATNRAIPDKSYIGFVGTHKDKLDKSKQQDVIEKLDARLAKLTGKIPILPAEKGVLFAVDNTTAGDSDTEDPVVKKLRNRIEKEVNKAKSPYPLKINWMILELDGTKFVKYEEYKKIAVGKALMVPEEVEESLYHFNKLGVFLHFNDSKVQGLRDYVIIDHQWLFDCLAMIMHLSPDDIDFQETDSREQFKKKGLLSKTELCSINWDSNFDIKYFFNLLIYFNVIVTVTLDDVEFYYMPCIFPSTKHYSDKYRFLYSEPLLVQFSSGFLPRGFFCSLVVCLLQDLPDGWDPQLNNTEHFSNVMTFELPDKSFLRLHDKTSYLEVQVRHYQGDLKISHCLKIFDKLFPYFEEVCKRLHLKQENLWYGFLCHSGESNDDHIAFINPFEFPLPSELKCSRKCPHSTKIGRLHKIWFEEVAEGTSSVGIIDVEDSDNIHLKPRFTEHSITTNLDQMLNQEPKMGDINKIVVPRIQAEWEDFAYALHYEIPAVQNISAKHNENPKKCCRELFIDWLSTDHGDGPKTWKTLIGKLKEVDELAAAISETI